ncbi:MAG: tRNA 4-thiouridine(8) synthase ThiI [Oscillospiraceae bacterium]|nr:tRNA 4-thiouridine(8) synthase ThiI [Oscillospiraceae bacterium]
MKEIILIKNGEIALKGLNRGNFESILIKNINKKIKNLGNFKISRSQSAIYIEPIDNNINIDIVLDKLKDVFGIATLCKTFVLEKDFEKIKEYAITKFDHIFKNISSFRVDAKRADKKFPMLSTEIESKIGEHVAQKYKNLSVSLKNPEVNLTIEIREKFAYIYCGKIEGAKGMPIGSSGNGMLMLSGGIDSPVSGYMMAKRGLQLSAIHFIAPPYTSDKAEEKVKELALKLSRYTNIISYYSINFTEIQLAIKKYCDENLFTIIMRRIMILISEKISVLNNIDCLITGESLAQVASQTLQSISCTNEISNIPIFRPLIGMDKLEIIDIAKRIDTFETSILPYEDCCTIFTPKHPKTKPDITSVKINESKFDFMPIIEKAILSVKLEIISNY